MNPKDPESLNLVLGNVLRYGVILSGLITATGLLLLTSVGGNSDAGTLLRYDPNAIPHGTFDVSLRGLILGLGAFEPGALIELGAIVLIATPVARVFVSVFLFSAEGNRLYVIITAAVLALLLFGLLLTPFIPVFQA